MDGPVQLVDDAAVQAVYDGLHDAVCLHHGPYCAESAPMLRDGIRAGLLRASALPRRETDREALARVQEVRARWSALTQDHQTARLFDDLVAALEGGA